MNTIFRPSWWLQMFISTLMTMIFIYLIKKASNKVNIPIVNEVVNGV